MILLFSFFLYTYFICTISSSIIRGIISLFNYVRYNDRNTNN